MAIGRDDAGGDDGGDIGGSGSYGVDGGVCRCGVGVDNRNNRGGCDGGRGSGDCGGGGGTC